MCTVRVPIIHNVIKKSLAEITDTFSIYLIIHTSSFSRRYRGALLYTRNPQTILTLRNQPQTKLIESFLIIVFNPLDIIILI